MDKDAMLAELNQTLGQARRQLNELLHLTQISREELARFESLRRRIQKAQNNPDVEKAAAELEQLYSALEEAGKRLEDKRRDISSEQLYRLQQNISEIDHLTAELTQLTQKLQESRDSASAEYYRALQIVGNPTIPPSLLHIFKQSLMELDNHIDVVRTMVNSELNSDLSPEIKNEIWENALRLVKTARAANKWVGIDVNEFPFDDFLNKFLPPFYPYRRFHHFREHYFARFPEFFKKTRFRTEENENIFELYLVLEIHTRYISTLLKKEYHSLPVEVEQPGIEFEKKIFTQKFTVYERCNFFISIKY